MICSTNARRDAYKSSVRKLFWKTRGEIEEG